MKRILIFALLTFLLLSCAACGESSYAPKELNVTFEAEGILSRYGISGGTFYTPGGEDALDEDLILSYFGDATSVPDLSLVETYALYIDETKPIAPCEFGIFKMKDAGDAETLKAFLQARIDRKLRNAALYPNMDTSALTSAKVSVMGNYVWYCAVKDANDEIEAWLRGND